VILARIQMWMKYVCDLWSVGFSCQMKVAGQSYETDGTSGSDFSRGKQAEVAARREPVNLRRGIVDTDSEDREIDEELEGDAVSESEDTSYRPVRHRKKKKRVLTAQDKGKGRGRASDNSADEPVVRHPVDTDGAALLREDWPKVSGPFPAAAKEEALALGRLTRIEAAKIAKRYRKKTRDVMVLAGLGIKSARIQNNPANKFRAWYADNNPKPEESESPCVSFAGTDADSTESDLG
jgi:hypothetical protein